MREVLWTVARFPSGMWATGGSYDDPGYAECEVFRVMARTRDGAKKKAQAVRRRQRAARPAKEGDKPCPDA